MTTTPIETTTAAFGLDIDDSRAPATAAERCSTRRRWRLWGPLALLGADLVSAVLATFVVYSVLSGGQFWDRICIGIFVGYGLVTILGWLGAYEVRQVRSRAAQFSVAVGIVVVAAEAMLAGLVLVRTPPTEVLSKTAGFATLAALLFGLPRLAMAVLAKTGTPNDVFRRRVAVLGPMPVSNVIASYIRDNPGDAIELVGVYDSSDQPGATATLVGALLTASRRDAIDDILVVLAAEQQVHAVAACRALKSVVSHVYVLIENLELQAAGKRYPRAIAGYPLLLLHRPELDNRQWVMKAAFDLVLSAILLLLLLPAFAAVAVAIKLDSRGPVIFKQPRIGYNNVPFICYKFRTMYHHMSDYLGDHQTSRNDLRVTRVGRLLRKLSIDEVPQLFNVLRGDMSLVGPRPHALNTKASGRLFEEAIPDYAERHRVKPGITGWAQVNGWRGEVQTLEHLQQRIACDLHYINKWSILFDLKILFLTVTRELCGRNAF